MINKRSLWFLTLFSLILVLSVYYITMPSELLLTNHDNYNTSEKKDTKKDKKTETKEKEKTKVTVKESELLTSLRVEANDEMLKEMDELKEVMTSKDATSEEKNTAFEKMKELNTTRGNEENMEKKIKDEFQLSSFVKIDGDQIRVVVNKDNLDKKTANNIMRSVQTNFDKKMYISVKFQK